MGVYGRMFHVSMPYRIILQTYLTTAHVHKDVLVWSLYFSKASVAIDNVAMCGGVYTLSPAFSQFYFGLIHSQRQFLVLRNVCVGCVGSSSGPLVSKWTLAKASVTSLNGKGTVLVNISKCYIADVSRQAFDFV